MKRCRISSWYHKPFFPSSMQTMCFSLRNCFRFKPWFQINSRFSFQFNGRSNHFWIFCANITEWEWYTTIASESNSKACKNYLKNLHLKEILQLFRIRFKLSIQTLELHGTSILTKFTIINLVNFFTKVEFFVVLISRFWS